MTIIKNEDTFDQATLNNALDAPKNTLNSLTETDFSKGCFQVDQAPSMVNATVFPDGHSVAWGYGSRLGVNFNGEGWSKGGASVGDTYGQFENRIWDGTGSFDLNVFQTVANTTHTTPVAKTLFPYNYDDTEEGWVIIRTYDIDSAGTWSGTYPYGGGANDNGSVPAKLKFVDTMLGGSSLADKNITGILVRGSCETGAVEYQSTGALIVHSGVMLGIAVKARSATSSAGGWHIIPKSIGQFTGLAHRYTTISTGCLITDTDLAGLTDPTTSTACSKLEEVALVSCISRFSDQTEMHVDDDEYEIGGYTLSCLPILAGTLN